MSGRAAGRQAETERRAPGAENQAQKTKNQEQGARHLEHGAKHQELGAKRQERGAKDRARRAKDRTPEAEPDAELKAYFGTKLLTWFREAARDLPWRRTRDPYHIWVSEIMLQQTRVDTVIPYFLRFIERFPTIRDLAEAPEAEVLKMWEGLGYYSRARNLQAAARQVMERHGGAVPADKAAVSALKGVGPYTAGAILSIAFNRPEPAVDGNVMRVLSRFFLLEGDIAKPAVREGLEELARDLIPEGEAANFNQALMELGALVCTPRSPGCLTCPVMERCAGRLAGRAHELPVKAKAKPPKPEHRLAALIWGRGEHAGKVLVRRRPKAGLLAGMWELPHVEAPNASIWRSTDAGPDWLAGALAAEGLRVRPVRPVADAEHVFSHLHWHVKVWEADLLEGSIPALSSFAGGVFGGVREEGAVYLHDAGDDAGGDRSGGAAEIGLERDDAPSYRWVGKDEFENLAWPKMFRTLLSRFFASADAGLWTGARKRQWAGLSAGDKK